MIVLDTHVLLWWASNPGNLSPKAIELIEESMVKKAIYLSSITIWEIAMLCSRGRLELTMNVEDWISSVESLPFVNFVPVNNRIAFLSVNLPDFPYPDPVDRIIIATTRFLRATLITRDHRILSYPHLKSVW